MHTQRLTLTLTALASAGLLLTACGTESGAGSDGGSADRSAGSAPAITGIRWNVDSVTVGGKKYEAPDGAHLKIGIASLKQLINKGVTVKHLKF